MIRKLTSLGCSLGLVVGAAGFLGCGEQGATTEGQYGTPNEVNQGLDTQSPALDGTGVGLDTEPMRDPALGDRQPTPPPTSGGDRPGMPAPQDIQSDPNSPAIPQSQPMEQGNQQTPGESQPAIPDTPTGGGM